MHCYGKEYVIMWTYLLFLGAAEHLPISGDLGPPGIPEVREEYTCHLAARREYFTEKKFLMLFLGFFFIYMHSISYQSHHFEDKWVHLHPKLVQPLRVYVSWPSPLPFAEVSRTYNCSRWNFFRLMTSPAPPTITGMQPLLAVCNHYLIDTTTFTCIQPKVQVYTITVTGI